MSVQDTAQQLIAAAEAESDPFARSLLLATAGEYIAQALWGPAMETYGGHVDALVERETGSSERETGVSE